MIDGSVRIEPTRDGLPLEERRINEYLIVALCKADKEQLNRVEELLKDMFKRDVVNRMR